MQNKVTRSDIVKSARSFLGVPWRHQGRGRKGCDCVGLVAAVADDLGILPEDFKVPAYRTEPDGTLLNHFDKYMTRVPLTEIQEGTAVVFSYLNSPWHAGIVVNLSARAVIHSFAPSRKVVTDYLDNKTNGRRLVRAYDYREVAD